MLIVICEDNKYWREELERCIERWAASRVVEATVLSASTAQELLNYIKEYPNVDAVLLDITLSIDNEDGIMVASRMRKFGITAPIIFVTGDADRAPEGYLVEAMGYVVKPIDQKVLFIYLDRIHAARNNEPILKIETANAITKIRHREILFIEVFNHTITIHTIQGSVDIRGTLTDVIDQLGNNEFTQIHRAFIVHNRKILSIKSTYPYSVTLASTNGSRALPVSRKYISTLIQVYVDNVLERMT